MSGRSEQGAHGGADPLGHALAVAYVDYDKLLEEFLRHAEAADAARWAMGELAASLYTALHRSPELRRQFARQGLGMRTFAHAVGLAPSALDALRLTAELFPPRERVAALSWEHHRALAIATPQETIATRRKWLREANKKRWTPHQLRREASPATSRRATCMEERVRRLRDRLAEAEAELEIRRRENPAPRPRRSPGSRRREK